MAVTRLKVIMGPLALAGNGNNYFILCLAQKSREGFKYRKYIIQWVVTRAVGHHTPLSEPSVIKFMEAG